MLISLGPSASTKKKLSAATKRRCCRSRVISRAPGLKLVVETLITSLRPIGNIVLICCAFFIVFGILGVQVNTRQISRCAFPRCCPVLLVWRQTRFRMTNETGGGTMGNMQMRCWWSIIFERCVLSARFAIDPREGLLSPRPIIVFVIAQGGWDLQIVEPECIHVFF